MAAASSAVAPRAMAPFSSLFDEVPLSTAEVNEPLYLVTNEFGQKATLAELESKPVKGNVVIAVSGMSALNLLATRILKAHGEGKEIEGLIVVDQSQRCERFWENLGEIVRNEAPVETSFLGKVASIFTKTVTDAPVARPTTPEEVTAKIKKLITDKKEYYFPIGRCTTDARLERNLRDFDRELSEGTSWLSSPAKFEAIREVFQKRHVKFLRLDLTSSDSCGVLGRVLRENSLEVDTLYTSNVLEYLSAETLPAYRASIHALPALHSLIVDTIPRCPCEYPTSGPTQRVRARDGLSVDELFLPPPHCEELPGSYMYVPAIMNGQRVYIRYNITLVSLPPKASAKAVTTE